MAEVEKRGIEKAEVGLVVSVILIVILSATNIWFYTSLQNQIGTPNNEKSNLQAQVNTLQTDKTNLQNQINTLQTDKTNLQNQINTLKAPQLVKIHLEETDNRIWVSIEPPYFHLRSIVVNLGSNTAYDCKLHVVLYHGAVITKETDILLGSISGKNWKSIDERIYYTGSALTDCTVMPEWSATP